MSKISFGALIGLSLTTIVVGIIMATTIHRDTVFMQYQLDVHKSSEYIYNSIKRDVILAGAMVSSWDSLSATESIGDTLLIRFSSIDSVKYFRTDNDILYREDVPIVDNIKLFKLTKNPSDAIDITVLIVAENNSMIVENYQEVFKWTIVSRNFTLSDLSGGLRAGIVALNPLGIVER